MVGCKTTPGTLALSMHDPNHSVSIAFDISFGKLLIGKLLKVKNTL
jgi:hypothetical protein